MNNAKIILVHILNILLQFFNLPNIENAWKYKSIKRDGRPANNAHYEIKFWTTRSDKNH